MKSFIFNRMKNFKISGHVQRTGVEYGNGKTHLGTVVDMYGNHLTVLFCMEGIWKFIGEDDNMIRIIRSQSLSEDAELPEMGQILPPNSEDSDSDDNSGKTPDSYKAELQYELTSNEKLGIKFMKFLKKRINPIFYDASYVRFMNTLGWENYKFFCCYIFN